MENGKIKVKIKILLIQALQHTLKKLPINDIETFPWRVIQFPIYHLQVCKIKLKAKPSHLKIEKS